MRDLSFGQWWLVSAPIVAGVAVAGFSPDDLDRMTRLYLLGGSVALSAGLLFLMLYGDSL